MSRNFDYPVPLEGGMAKSLLWQIEQDARQLREQLQDTDDLPGWVQSKIATSADRIHTVNRYLTYKIARAEAKVNCGCGCNGAPGGCGARRNPLGDTVGAGPAIWPAVGFIAAAFALGLGIESYQARRRQG